MKDNIIAIIHEQISDSNGLDIVCKNIVDKLDIEYGNQWHCIVSHRIPIHSYFVCQTGYCISLSFGSLFFKVYKTINIPVSFVLFDYRIN